MWPLHFRAPRQSTVSCGPSWPRYLGARGSASLPEDEAVEQGDEADRALPPSRSAREPGSLSPVFDGRRSAMEPITTPRRIWLTLLSSCGAAALLGVGAVVLGVYDRRSEERRVGKVGRGGGESDRDE